MAPPPRHQQTSVVFGYDEIDYKSSMTAMNDCIAAPDRVATGKTRENINKGCHVQFGEPGKKRDFTISSTQLDPTGEIHKYTAKLNADTKKMLLKTSSAFGTDPPSYVTSTQLATSWNKLAAQESIALGNEIRKRTGPRPTRGMSYDDEIEYVCESKSQYQNKLKDFKPSLMAEAVKNDLRATHYTLGHEKLDYTTSSHVNRLLPEEFAKSATRQPPPHDLRKSSVEIS